MKEEEEEEEDRHRGGGRWEVRREGKGILVCINSDGNKNPREKQK